MERKTKFAFAAAVGAVSLMALNAIAQPQPGNAPAANPSAPKAPADQKPADNAAKPGDNAAQSPQQGDRDNWQGRRGHWARGDGDNQRGWHRGGGQRRGEGRGEGRGMRNMSEADRKAFFEARLAAVKAGLQLNETQLRLWPPVETAVREMIAKRQEWRERIRKEGRPANPVDRMKRRGDFMADRGTALQKFANAAKPLYDTLTDEQKRRLRILTRGMGQRGMMQGGRQGMRGHHHRGMGRQGMGHEGLGHEGMGRQGMNHGGDRWQRHGQYHQRWNRNDDNRGGMQGRGMPDRGMQGQGMQDRGMMGQGNERWQRQGQYHQRWNRDEGAQQGRRLQQGNNSGDDLAREGRRDRWQQM